MRNKNNSSSLPLALVNALAARARANDTTMRLVCSLLVALVLAAMALPRTAHDNNYKLEAAINL